MERRWIEHFYQLLNRPEPTEPVAENVAANDEEVMPPSLNEVRAVLKALKNNKAPGPDNVPAELLKHGGEEMVKALHEMIADVWETEAIPKTWEEGCLTVLHKSGDKNDCGNYRGITLLSVGYKVLANLLFRNLVNICDTQLGDYQAGFRRNKSTSDHIFTIRQILEKYREYNKDNYHLFIDFKQAYDSVHRHSVWNILAQYNVPSKMIRLVKACYKNSRASVIVNGNRTEPFDIQGGLRQGCPLSTLLFNVTLDWVMRQTP